MEFGRLATEAPTYRAGGSNVPSQESRPGAGACRIMALPAEVIQNHLLPHLRADQLESLSAFSSTCRVAHMHVMEAAARPLMGHLNVHFDPCSTAVGPFLGAPHSSALAYAAATRLENLFGRLDTGGLRLPPYNPEQPLNGPKALSAIDGALDALLAAVGGPMAVSIAPILPVLAHLKATLLAPLDVWAAKEEVAYGPHSKMVARTRGMVVAMANAKALQLDLAVCCRPTTLAPVWLYFAQLTTLRCRRAYLTQLPEAIGHLKNLEVIDLSDNRLSQLPNALKHLHRLRVLGLRRNSFEKVPDVLKYLPKLEHLDLFGNKLVDVAALSHLTALKELDLGDCHLEELPQSICALPLLESLGLHFNQISMLPDEIGRFANLEHLDLGHNRITHLPDAMASLVKMQSLYLSNNRLSSLPAFVFTMAHLKVLCVSSTLNDPAVQS